MALAAPAGSRIERPGAVVSFTLNNTGGEAAGSGVHLDYDVYRLSVSVEGKGWTARLINALAAVKSGASQPVAIYVSHGNGSDRSATVTLRAASESDPSKTATASVIVS